MKIAVPDTGMPSELKAEMQELCDRISKGILPTMEERIEASARIDRRREENFKKFGVQNVAVEAVRESRNKR